MPHENKNISDLVVEHSRRSRFAKASVPPKNSLEIRDEMHSPFGSAIGHNRAGGSPAPRGRHVDQAGRRGRRSLDDLRSYGQLIDAHADGVKKLESPFEALYESMSSTQKHNADPIFRNERHAAHKKG